MMPMPNTNAIDAHRPQGARLVSLDDRSLPLTGTTIRVRAGGGLARVVLEQRFENPYDEPLSLRYQLPLPADGTVSGFSFQLGEQRIVGEVDRRDRARQRYERAIVEGHSAAILEQDRSSLFTQDVGNVPPRQSVVAEIVVDQKLAWLPDGQWEWRFPTVVAPRYQGGPGRVADHDRQIVDVSDGPRSLRAALSLTITDAITEGGAPSSPSHALAIDDEGKTPEVGFRSRAGAPLDRDIAIRWPVRGDEIDSHIDVARPPAGHPGAEDAYALLTLVPPEGPAPNLPRDLILLLDTSGSMSGQPLDQARRVAIALVESLTDEDRLEMVEFSTGVRRWRPEPCAAGADARAAAIAWLMSLSARGGTEMHQGIVTALEPLRDEAQRQVVLFTDGLIGFEEEVIGAIGRQLPGGCRVHCVGVGAAVNRSLTGPAARAGRGVESIVAIGEDAEPAAARLVAHTAAPLVVDLTIEGEVSREHAPTALPDLMAGAPALLSLRTDPAGGKLRISGRTATGRWEREIEVPRADRDSGAMALVARFAREKVEDLETDLAAAPQRRERIDAEIERLGLDFQIASRRTSWVAIGDERTVDPQSPSRREVIPQELPHGMSMAGLGLRPPTPRVMAARSGVIPAPRACYGFAPPPPPAGPAGPPPGAGRPPGAVPPPAPAAMPARGGRRVDGVRDAFGVERQGLAASGRVLLAEAGRVVVEITLPVELDWQPPADATLRFTDGTEQVRPVVTASSTRPGTVASGGVVRLTLRWDEPETAPSIAELEAVHLSVGGGTMLVRLSPRGRPRTHG